MAKENDAENTRDIKFLNSYLNSLFYVYNRYREKVYSSNGYPVPRDGAVADQEPLLYYEPGKWSKVVLGYVAIIR